MTTMVNKTYNVFPYLKGYVSDVIFFKLSLVISYVLG